MNDFRAVGVIVVALAAVLLAGLPATAAPAQETGTRSVTSTLEAGARTVTVDSFCIVTNGFSCVTAPLRVDRGATIHIATLGIPSPPPYPPGVPDPVTSSVIVRHLDAPGAPEIVRDIEFRGDEHNLWHVGPPAGNYRAELNCHLGCQGATLYFDIV